MNSCMLSLRWLLVKLMTPLRLPLTTIRLTILNTVLGIPLNPIKKIHELVPAHLDRTDPLGHTNADQIITKSILDKGLKRVKDLRRLPLKANLIHPWPHMVENMAGADLDPIILLRNAHLHEQLFNYLHHFILVLVLEAVLEILDTDQLILKSARAHVKHSDGGASHRRANAAIIDLDQLRLLTMALATFGAMAVAHNICFHEQVDWQKRRNTFSYTKNKLIH